MVSTTADIHAPWHDVAAGPNNAHQLVLSSTRAALSSAAHHADALCKSNLGWGPTTDARDTIDFTPCFEDSAIQLFPVLILAIWGTWELVSLRNAPKRDDQLRVGGRWRDSLAGIKAFLALVISGFEIIYLVLLHFGNATAGPITTVSSVLTIIATIEAASLTTIAHPRLRHSSTPLLFFWLFSAASSLLHVRTAVVLPPSSPLSPQYGTLSKAAFVIECFALSFQIVIFAFECIGPETPPPPADVAKHAAEQNGQAEQGIEDEAQDPTEQAESPLITSNIFSRLMFGWMTPMMRQGHKKYLTEDDLWRLPEDDQATVLVERFEEKWAKQLEKKNPSLTIALIQAFGYPFFVASALKFFQDILAFAQPQLLRLLLAFVSSHNTSDPEPASRGYIIAIAMLVISIAQTAFLHQYFQFVFETGMRLRAAIISAIYRKSLVLSSTERRDRATGDIVNLQSTDASRLQDVCTYGQIIWSGTFQLILAFVSLYALLGWSMLAGVGVMLLSIPLTTVVTRWGVKLQKGLMKEKDKRSRLMSEILTNIRSIKLYAWETAFAKRLFAVRNGRELPQLRKMGYVSSFNSFLWSFFPFLVAFVTFLVSAVSSDRPLTPDVIFPALSLFQMLQFPLNAIPMVITAWLEAAISIGRLQSFLTAGELQKDAVVREDVKEGEELRRGQVLLKVEKGEFKWAEEGEEATLTGIDISVKKGDLVAVVGRVGSGKSSLLSATLGEMHRTHGTAWVKGRVAYACQSAFILGGSIKSNIIFGHRWDPEFYDLVLDSCALRQDLASLKDGDATEVGEKGISLSGGQKARIALARAVYARADVYLFDDPLSAVDAHVARHLFDRVIGPDGILSSKARVLCTNAIGFIKLADEMIMLRNGTIIERGSYADHVHKDTEIGRLLTEFGRVDQADKTETDAASSTVVDSEADAEVDGTKENDPGESAITEEDQAAFQAKLKKRKLSVSAVKRAPLLPPREQARRMLAELKKSAASKENRSTGSVGWGVYRRYIAANGILGCTLFVLTIVVQQTVSILTSVWLKNWSDHNLEPGAEADIKYYLSVYFALGAATSVLLMLNGILLWSLCTIRSSKTMHDSMYHGVIRSPMRFFDQTPIGTILNRFSRDVYVLDEVMARSFNGLFRVSAVVVGTVVVISYSAPLFLCVAIPMLLVYKRIQTYYLATSRELKRLDATTKSPIFAAFQETLGGLSTIRAYRQQERFVAESDLRVDRNLQAYWPSISCNRWLAVRLELIGAVLIFAAALLAVVALVKFDGINAGTVGLMMSYALSMTQALNWVVRSASEVETNIVSVERVQEYIQLEPEAPLIVEGNRPAASWPERGEVIFEDLSLRYRDGLDLVLKDVSMDIKPEESVGVVGRTGAGKSSLTMALFRVVEPASGRIIIDGVDVHKIGLHDLRSKLSIIPQDPQLFEGSLRENVDPEEKATDEELWRALDQARLKDHVQNMGGLDAHVDEAGSNLSNGQRQLICLARALLRGSKILVLDEATSAIDPESDKQIQSVIRTEFENRTLITIAHRLDTIIGSDRILVMSDGKVAEFDTPRALYAKKDDSLFYALAKEAGVAVETNKANGSAH